MTSGWTTFVVSLVAGLVVAVAVSLLLAFALRLVMRRRPSAERLVRTGRLPLRILLATLAVWAAIASALPVSPAPSGVPPLVYDVLTVAARVVTIVSATWLVAAVVLWLQDRGVARTNVDVADNLSARRVRTQMLLVRRLTLGLFVVLGLGAVLLSFPGVSAIGASVLASAGIISVIAAVAAQSTLGNVIAGIQIAFGGSIRIDDAVIVEQEWGWVEEITLTYVVVKLWDQRRLVLPSTYFTTTPFQNWTRNHSELLGSVELDLDWRVDTRRMRTEVDRLLAETDLWDGRVGHVQVTDAVGGLVRVRVLVTAHDAPTLFDLRCLVREGLVEWVRAEDPDAMPLTRLEHVAGVDGQPRNDVISSSSSPGASSGM